MNREPIYQALFELLQGVAGVTTLSRRLRHWSDVPASDQPALYMAQASETARVVTGQPARWLILVNLYLYAHGSHEAPPASYLNPIIDAVEAAFPPANQEMGPPGTVQTLSGLVAWARLQGTIRMAEGAMGDQAVAIIPIEILVS